MPIGCPYGYMRTSVYFISIFPHIIPKKPLGMSAAYLIVETIKRVEITVNTAAIIMTAQRGFPHPSYTFQKTK
jgi:hypothetical protein